MNPTQQTWVFIMRMTMLEMFVKILKIVTHLLVTVWKMICKVNFFLGWQLVPKLKSVLICNFIESKWLQISFVIANATMSSSMTNSDPIAVLKTTLYIEIHTSIMLKIFIRLIWAWIIICLFDLILKWKKFLLDWRAEYWALKG